MITIKCSAGLANRLRFIFSFRKAVDINDSHSTIIKVLWPINSSCVDTFESCFQNIENIIFEYLYVIDYTKHCDIEQCSYFKDFTPERYRNFYSSLLPNQKILNKTNNLINKILSKHNAVHIRKTDMMEKTGYLMDEKQIQLFILNSSLPVYLATDDAKVQKEYKLLYGDKILMYSDIKYDNFSLRQTTLEHSVIDMFMCIKSNIFFPCNFSSFSDLIKYKRLEYV